MTRGGPVAWKLALRARPASHDWSHSVSQTLPPDTAAPAEGGGYDAYAIQQKWQARWAEADPFRAGGDEDTRPRKYVLGMFPYPSGDLHMGHAESYAYVDVVARFWRHRGYNVLNPIGWDSFGLPAENAAIQRGADPREWTYANIEQHKKSFREYGSSYDWSRILHTSDPEYYRWNQWLFQRLYERGLAYRKESPVNWCPNDQTVLANEQVVDGHCERCGAEVVKKKLTQWYFKITDYADRLLDDLNQLEGFWPQKVIRMQRNWIGRSVGADIDFEIEGRDGHGHGLLDAPRHAARRDVLRRRARQRPGGRARRGLVGRGAHAVPGLPRARPARDRHRAAEHRPPEDRASSSIATRSTRSTASGCRSGPPTTCSPTTATARSWPSPRTISATSTSRARSTCR